MKTTLRTSVFLFIIACLFFTSCEKVFLGKNIDNTPSNNFKYLWQKVEMGYSFFDVKEVHWDSVFHIYSLQITDDMTDEALFDVLANMLNELKDGHVNLYSPFKTSRYDISMLGPVNINFRNVKEFYLQEDYTISGALHHGFLENQQIGYIRYASFAGNLSNQSLQYVFNRYKNTQGLILDIRQNGGGAVSNVFKLLSCFVKDKTPIYTSSIKSGYKGQNDTSFSAPETVYALPSSSNIYYAQPLVVLIDRGSYSASSFFSVACKALPHVTLVGDTTGGGLGLPNGGQLPNGWTYRFSITRTMSMCGNNWENGIPPDIFIRLQDNHSSTGIDDVIDKAIEYILNAN
jgi:hypothetical protein